MPISSGLLCQKCESKRNRIKQGYSFADFEKEEKMRFPLKQ
jgi:hypothetical protein